MKILLSWLNDYIETGLSAEQIAEILSNLGLPIEGIEHLDGDAVIDVEVTSNRGDCLGYIGIARELAAATGAALKMPTVKLDESDRQVSEFASVEILEPDLCCRYTARIIEAAKVGPSPDWLKRRLEAVGVRSVNNVVDATNYAMMETGQPPHAFDYAKISEGKIIVRKALAGERIVSIDGSKCELDSEMLIIADAAGPVAIAGVMGGIETEVSERTTTILLEDAYFDPVSVRRTYRRLSLPSEAAFRFERTVDIEMLDWASKRTAQLITQAASGKAAKGVIDVYPRKKPGKQVQMRLGRLKGLLGIEVAGQEVLRILSALDFKPQLQNDTIICSVPSWRSDVYREADLIEEVARVYGYNKIPTEEKIRIEVIPVDNRQKITESIGRYLNGCGFYETINVSFIDDSVTEFFHQNDVKDYLSIEDTSGRSANLLRQSLIGSLLGVMKTNFNSGNSPCRIFEIADTFVPAGKGTSELPVQKTKLALACEADFRDLCGVVEGLVKTIARDAETVFVPADLLWAKGGAEILVNRKRIGFAGVISRAVKEKFDFEDITPAAAELDFEELLGLQGGPVRVKQIPRFPAIQRDLSIIVDETICWADIAEAVGKKASDELEDVQFVGIYRGEGVPPGGKSITLTLTFRDRHGTLTHEKVDRLEADIVAGLGQFVAARLRGL